MTKLVVGNWKMNGSRSLIEQMVETLKQEVLNPPLAQVAICPPFPLIPALESAVAQSSIGVGAQNVSNHLSGAYTGDVSVSMLKEFNVTYGIVGHSERRSYFGETDELVQQKVKILLEHGIRPIMCIGESLEQRESGEHEATVLYQLVEGLKDIAADQIAQCVIAYEPVWAIGTGKTATPEQANQMHQVIRTKLIELTSEESAKAIPILYGGSVKGSNAAELLNQSDIDGALVGGASLKPDDFCQIIRGAS